MTNPLKWDYYHGNWDCSSEIMDEFGPYTWSIDVTHEGVFSLVDTEPELLTGIKERPTFTTLKDAKEWCQNREDEIVADAATMARSDAKYGKEWCDEPGC